LINYGFTVLPYSFFASDSVAILPEQREYSLVSDKHCKKNIHLSAACSSKALILAACAVLISLNSLF